jgi:arginyl-tRNA synthetase
MKERIYDLIKKAVREMGISEQEMPAFTLEHPDEMSHGDFATNVAMVLYRKTASVLDSHVGDINWAINKDFIPKNPRDLAEKLVAILNKDKSDEIEKIELAGPGFINFYLSPKYFASGVGEILNQKEKYGGKKKSFFEKLFSGKKVIVEYSSPNIAKPFTVGHLRSTIIGDAVANILEFSGHQVIRDNHLGDWGTQFGKLIVALKKWSSIENIEKSEQPIKDLVDLYVRFHEEAEKDKALEDEGRAWFSKLEKGDKEARGIWQKCVALSMKEFDRIYKVLDVRFDTVLGESFYEDKMADVIVDVKKKNIARESEGAYLIFFKDEKYPPLMLLKTDGSSLYALRDLAADKWRKKKYGPDTVIINEVGMEQELQFQQLFEAERLLGYVKEGERVHVAHGLYRFKEGKMSTRKGNVIWLDEVIKEAIERAGAINKETAEVVAIGAIKFNDLKREAKGDINFDWDEILNLKGDSGPYLQYACVRAKSILEKARKEGIKSQLSGVNHELSGELSKLLIRFPEVVERAGVEYAPHYLATYLITLAGAFSTFYAQETVVDKNDASSPYKVALTEAFSIVMKNGLHLLGIKVPDKM